MLLYEHSHIFRVWNLILPRHNPNCSPFSFTYKSKSDPTVRIWRKKQQWRFFHFKRKVFQTFSDWDRLILRCGKNIRESDRSVSDLTLFCLRKVFLVLSDIYSRPLLRRDLQEKQTPIFFPWCYLKANGDVLGCWWMITFRNTLYSKRFRKNHAT